MSRFTAWVRWEFGRSIEVTPFLTFVIIERFLKGGLLVLGGLALLIAGEATDLHRWAANLQDQIAVGSSGSLWRRAVGYLLDHLGSLSDRGRNELAVAIVLYGGLEIFEGVGLLLRRRWAEYLLLIATAAFLPLEIDELVRRVTIVKVLAFALNLVIVVYLVRQKRLFLERPGDDHATAPT